MRLPALLLCAILCGAIHAHGQEVPPRVLDSIIRHETNKGLKLERIIKPDFNQPTAPNHTYLGECYPGKMLLLIIIMAQKPSDLIFKVTSVAKTGEIKPLQEFELWGKKYWLDFQVVTFRKDMSDRTSHCLFVRSDDRANPRLPIYQIFLTEPY